MIQIKPTTSCLLNHQEFSLTLPGSLSFNVPRASKSVRTLDGGVAITLWKKNKAGAITEKSFLLNQSQYKILEQIIYHETVFEWLVFSGESRFLCSLDFTKDEQITFDNNPDFKNVSVQFFVIQEL